MSHELWAAFSGLSSFESQALAPLALTFLVEARGPLESIELVDFHAKVFVWVS